MVSDFEVRPILVMYSCYKCNYIHLYSDYFHLRLCSCVLCHLIPFFLGKV